MVKERNCAEGLAARNKKEPSRLLKRCVIRDFADQHLAKHERSQQLSRDRVWSSTEK